MDILNNATRFSPRRQPQLLGGGFGGLVADEHSARLSRRLNVTKLRGLAGGRRCLTRLVLP
jgi:hypothetical protein